MKSHRDSPSPSVHSHQPPLTPTYITPRTAPKPPTSPSPFKLPSLFRKRTRAVSIHSAASTTTSSSDNHPSHPYSSLHMPPIPVVSSHSVLDDDDECPVCLEPLSFSFRLPGEKPHIVPECGHDRVGMLHRCLWPTPQPRARASSQIQSRCLRCMQAAHEGRRWRWREIK